MSEKDAIASLNQEIKELTARMKNCWNPNFKQELQTIIDVLKRKRTALKRQSRRWF